MVHVLIGHSFFFPTLHSSFLVIIHQPKVFGDLGLVAAFPPCGNQTWTAGKNPSTTIQTSINSPGNFIKTSMILTPESSSSTSCWLSQLVSQWYAHNVPRSPNYYPCIESRYINSKYHFNYVLYTSQWLSTKSPVFPIISHPPHIPKGSALQSKVSPTSLATAAAVWHQRGGESAGNPLES